MPDYKSESAGPEEVSETGLEEAADPLALPREEPASPAMPFDRGIDLSADRVEADRVEVERLRELLREQEEATLRAINTAADLQSQLSTAQTEVIQIGTQYHGFSREARAAVAQKAAEVEIARAKLERHHALLELERQKQERKAEATQAAAKLSLARNELTIAEPRPERSEERRVGKE